MTRRPTPALLADPTHRPTPALLADLAFFALLVSLLYTPFPEHLAGTVFAQEFFLHWDHFAMAPAVAWRHGMALSTDVYNQYSAGWPVVLNVLDPWFPLHHRSAIQLAVLYACLHHAGLYALLRVAGATRLLAAGGTLAVLAATVFSPLIAAQPNLAFHWQWPSLTVLRAPMDVWFFLLLFLHARRPTLLRSAGLGALAGLAIWFETDTGVFLAGTGVVYAMLRALSAPFGSALAQGRAGGPSAFLLATVLALLVLLLGLQISSHGTLVSRTGDFVVGWVSGVTNSSSRGAGASLFTGLLAHSIWATPAAAGLVGFALFVFCDTLAFSLRGRLDATRLVAACLAVYALGRCTLFVWRTIPIRLTLVAVPIGVLLVLGAKALAGEMRRRRGDRGALAVEGGFALAAVAAIVLSPAFWEYPNAWRTLREGAPARGLVVFEGTSDLAGLPPRFLPIGRSLESLVSEVRRHERAGRNVGILDPAKTLVFLESGTPPWRGDASTFYNTWTHEDVDRLAREVELAGPAVLFLRSEPPGPAAADTWQALRSRIALHYDLRQRVGLFESWQRR